MKAFVIYGITIVYPGATTSIPADVICEPYLDEELQRPAKQIKPRAVMGIPHVDAAELTPQSFGELQQHSLPHHPLVIKGAAPALFEGYNASWTVSGLIASQSAGQKMPLGSGSQNHSALYGIPGKQTIDGRWSPKRMNLSDLFDSRTSVAHWRSMAFSEIRDGSQAADDLEVNPLFQEYFSKLRAKSFLGTGDPRFVDPSAFYLHLSNQGGSLPHTSDPALNVLFQGAKRWIVSDPNSWYAAIEDGNHSFSTSLDWFLEIGKNLASPHYDFIQLQGDAVFVPDGFVHASIDICKHTVGAVLTGHVLKYGTDGIMNLEFLERTQHQKDNDRRRRKKKSSRNRTQEKQHRKSQEL